MDENNTQSGSKPILRVAFFMLSLLSIVLAVLYFTGVIGASNKAEHGLPLSQNASPLADKPNAHLDNHAHQERRHFPIKGFSLSDTQIEPFTVTKDANGWVLPPNLRYYFEYFIQLQGEMPLDKIKQLVKKDLAKKHPPELSQYLYDLFLRYLDYRQAIDDLIMYENDIESSDNQGLDDGLSKEQRLREHIKTLQTLNMDEINDQVETIQAEYFNEAERKALFDEAFLERYGDEHTIKPKLDAYDKIKDTLKGDELKAARVTLFGSEAANRLQQLDQKREQWKRQLIDLQCQETAIEKSEGLSLADKTKQKQALLEQNFNDAQIRRIDALRRNQLLPEASCD